MEGTRAHADTGRHQSDGRTDNARHRDDNARRVDHRGAGVGHDDLGDRSIQDGSTGAGDARVRIEELRRQAELERLGEPAGARRLALDIATAWGWSLADV